MVHDDVFETFIEQSFQLLHEMEYELLAAAQKKPSEEALNLVYRSIHTIRGSAGFFDLQALADTLYPAEKLMEAVRSKEVELTDQRRNLLLHCCRHIQERIKAASRGTDISAKAKRYGDHLQTALMEQLGKPQSQDRSPLSLSSSTPYTHLSFRFHPALMQDQFDPMAFLRYLNTLGTIHRVMPMHKNMPSLSEIAPEQCYMGLEMSFESKVSLEVMEETLTLMCQGSTVHFLPPHSRLSDYHIMVEDLPENTIYLLQTLLWCGSLTQAEFEVLFEAEERKLNVPTNVFVLPKKASVKRRGVTMFPLSDPI